MNDNQNHRIKKGWTSSRVLSEPGGSGSLMLGMAPPPKKAAAPGECHCCVRGSVLLVFFLLLTHATFSR